MDDPKKLCAVINQYRMRIYILNILIALKKQKFSMKRQLCLMVALTLQYWFATAQKITPGIDPEGAGFSTQRLQRIDNAMNEWAQKGWMNGSVALIIRNGKIAYYKAAGY